MTVIPALGWYCAGVGSAVAVWGLAKWSAASSKRQAGEAMAEIVADTLEAARVPAPAARETAEALERILAAGRGDMPPALADVFRIECVYEKPGGGSDSYARRLIVYRRKEGGEAGMVTATREYGWTMLPASVRAQFIRNASSTRVIELLYDGEGGVK